jgi:Icc protein
MEFNRRNFIRGAMGAGLAAVAGAAIRAEDASDGRRTRVLRVAHLTDIHVTHDSADLDQPVEGMRAAIRHAQGQADPPQLIFFGGDMVFDSLQVEKDQALALWSIWSRIVADEVRIPYHLVLGNHDIWGWALHDRPGLASDPDFGKGLALRHLGLDRTYTAFSQAGWRFILLDSLQIDYGARQGYLCRLDDEQFYWLARELAQVDPSTPVCILSHVPILAACSLVDEHIAKLGTWLIPGAVTHRDALRIKNLFNQHRNVKLCLSGHIHLADNFVYRDVRYCCNGAVSGNWWKGSYEEYGPSYALVDFYDDGSVENQLIAYR